MGCGAINIIWMDDLLRYIQKRNDEATREITQTIGMIRPPPCPRSIFPCFKAYSRTSISAKTSTANARSLFYRGPESRQWISKCRQDLPYQSSDHISILTLARIIEMQSRCRISNELRGTHMDCYDTLFYIREICHGSTIKGLGFLCFNRA